MVHRRFGPFGTAGSLTHKPGVVDVASSGTSCHGPALVKDIGALQNGEAKLQRSATHQCLAVHCDVEKPMPKRSAMHQCLAVHCDVEKQMPRALKTRLSRLATV